MQTRKFSINSSLVWPLAVGLLSGCASKKIDFHSVQSAYEADFQSDTRGPASVEIQAEFEDIFQKMLASETFQENFILKMDQIEFSYYQGVAATRDFDQLLETEAGQKTPSPNFQQLVFEKGISPRLAAAESYGQNAHDQLKYHYLRLMQVYKDPSLSSSKKAKIEELFQYLAKYLREVPLSTRIALNSWAEDMFTVDPHSTVLQKAYEHLLVGQPDNLQELLQDPRVLTHQEKMMSKVLRVKDQYFASLVETFTAYQKDQFSGEGREPQSVTPEKPAAPNAWALALSGNPHHFYVPQIAENLKTQKVPATFFVVASRARQGRAVLRNLNDNGFHIQSAGWDQTEWPKLFSDEVQNQIGKSRSEILTYSAQKPSLVKVPFSAESPRIRELAQQERVQLVHESIKAYDRQDRNVEKQARRILLQARMQKSGVISFTMDQSTSGMLIDQVLKGLKLNSENQQFVSLEEFLP